MLESTPPGVVTSIVPEDAPLGTVALMLVLDATVNVAGVPLNVTLLAPVRSVPRIKTFRPTAPRVGYAFTNGASPVDRLKTVPQPESPKPPQIARPSDSAVP